MVLRLDIKKILSSRSDRVKCVDFHQSEPWILVSLYNGHVHIWNFETQTIVKTFEVTELPARTGKFISRKNWFIVGTDDMHLRVFNYNTHEKVHAYEAHTDYIRSLAVHPTQPYVLSSADDMLIKLWDWEKGWKNIMTFEGHTHYVMSVSFNPKDANTFASASLDKSIKIWNLGSSTPNYTLEGHEKGVNWVEYYHGGEKPYLVSAADDKLVKVWDYQNKTCVSTLEGHSQNVCVACFHPELPVILTGSEDGTVRVWHANTYRLENTLNYGMERVWSITHQRGSNNIGLGYDEGTIVIKLGREDPAVSMDSSGKIIWAKHNEIQTANIQSSDLHNLKDGDRLPLSSKDLGNCEVYPQTLEHSPNGRFAVVCGDGEYIIYTALSWRNKSFGSALEFVWAQDSNEYAVRESSSKIKTFKAFKEKNNLNMTFSAEGIYGGALLAVRGNTFVCFYDWNTGAMVRRIDVVPKKVYWSENGALVCISCADNFFILRYNGAALENAMASGNPLPEDGLDTAFDVVHDIPERFFYVGVFNSYGSAKNGCWVGDCFIYTTTTNRLNYLVGGQTHTVSHFDTPMYLLGYLPKESKIFVCDKDMNVFAYALSLQLLEYQTAILRRDFAAAQSVLPSLPKEQRNRVARFLEGLELKEMAMDVTTDIEHKFDLALQLSKLEVAYSIAQQSDSDRKWKQLGDFALADWKLPLAEECLKRANDIPGQLLLSIVTGNTANLEEVAALANDAGKTNVAFTALFLAGEVEECIDLLVASERLSEAAIMARTYLPSRVPVLVQAWKESLEKNGQKKSAKALMDPIQYETKFPDYKHSLIAELGTKMSRRNPRSASAYQEWKNADINVLLTDIKSKYPDPSALPPAVDLIQQAASLSLSTGTPSHSARVPMGAQPSSNTTSREASPARPRPSAQGSLAPVASTPTTPSPTKQVTVISPSASPSGARRSDVPPAIDDGDNVSDNMSHISMEVNTAGTESQKGDLDVDSTSDFGSTAGGSIAGGGASAAPPIVTSTHASPVNKDPFQMDELDAELLKADVTTATGGVSATSTGDPDLDDLLNI